MIDARELDRRLTLYRRDATDDGFSSSPGAPVEIGTVWAKKVDVSNTEMLAAAAVGQVITTRFLVRWTSQMTQLRPDDQAVCEGTRYEIVGWREARGRRVGIEITAKAIRS